MVPSGTGEGTQMEISEAKTPKVKAASIGVLLRESREAYAASVLVGLKATLSAQS
jgi:hypothetical protein